MGESKIMSSDIRAEGDISDSVGIDLLGPINHYSNVVPVLN
jgi:hypothetical protein